MAKSASNTDMTSQKHKLAEMKALENLLDVCTLDLAAVDEVWPNLYIGNVAIAQNKSGLRKMGITHILNAAHGKQGSIGDETYYGNEFVYYGVAAEDSGKFDISVHFQSASDFIYKALKKKKRKSAGALHYGSEPLVYFGPVLLNVTPAPFTPCCHPTSHPEETHLP